MPSDGVTIDRETYEMLRAFLNAEKSDVERMGPVRDEFCRRLAADELKDVSAESGAREQLSSGAKLFASAQYFISMIAISRIANGASLQPSSSSCATGRLVTASSRASRRSRVAIRPDKPKWKEG